MDHVIITVYCQNDHVIDQFEDTISEKYPFYCPTCETQWTTDKYPWYLRTEIQPGDSTK